MWLAPITQLCQCESACHGMRMHSQLFNKLIMGLALRDVFCPFSQKCACCVLSCFAPVALSLVFF